MSSTGLHFDRLRAFKTVVITRALNRSIVSARAAMVPVIAADMGLKSGTVRDRIRIEEATDGRPVARLYASFKRIPIIEFDAKGPEPSRGKGRGVTAKLSGARTRYPTAFVATMPSGHRGVFKRVPGAKRLKIRELRGPSIAHVFLKYKAIGAARGTEQLAKNLVSEFKFALSSA